MSNDKKTDSLFVAFLIVIVFSIFLTYQKYIVNQDINFHLDDEKFNEALSAE